MSLAHKCKVCGRLTSEESSQQIGKTWVIKYKCGHKELKKQVGTVQPVNALDSIVSNNRQYKLLPYQKDSQPFWAANNYRGLLADEMGLGKTVQSLIPLRQYPDELLPVLIVVKSSAKLQWMIETMDWIPNLLPQIINKGKDKPNPLFKCWIISYSLLEKMGVTAFDNLDIKTLIIDECHLIKNTQTGRAAMVKDLSEQIPHVLALSGTPIENNALEYFSILNILDSGKFPSRAHFISNWLDTYFDSYSGKMRTGGIRYPDYFHEFTEKMILRRRMKEVMKDLPELTRHYHYSELGDEVAQAYDEAYQNFMDNYENDPSTPNYFSNILGIMNLMRQLTGISKINPAFEWIQEFIETTDRKLVVFCHHDTVIDLLSKQTDQFLEKLGLEKSLKYISSLDSNQRHETVEAFKNNGTRVMFASTLTAGESINLQFVSDCYAVEREWNPSKEDQAFSGRFIRVGQKADKVIATIGVAIGTIDEFFAALIEQKRAMFATTMGDGNFKWEDTQIQRELADILYKKGKSKWRLKTK